MIDNPYLVCDSPDMVDPLSEIIALLKPRTVFSKRISGAGRWGVRYGAYGAPSFCTVIEGRCRLAVDGHDPVTLETGDFILMPATPGFVLSGFEPAIPIYHDPHEAAAEPAIGELRHGEADADPDVRLLGGYFAFAVSDTALLLSLLPALSHLRGARRLTTLVTMLGEEAQARQPGCDLVLERLVEILLIEALRAIQGDQAPPGLLRGLGDRRIAVAMRAMHGDPARPWTMAQLAEEAGMSRSAFFERFVRAVGAPPMEYLLAWRMALAKTLLRARQLALAEVAERVGYGSASTFSTAFRRHVGQPPGRYARAV